MRVDGPCDELLAGPALAFDEDRGLGGPGQPDELEDLAHAFRFPDDAPQAVTARQLLFQPAVFFRQPARLRPLAHRHEHFLVLEGLGDVVERALAHRLDRSFDGGVGGDDHDDGVRVPAADVAQDLEARAIREHEVEQDDVVRLGVEQRQGFAGVGGRRHVAAFFFQQGLEDVADDLFVVHDQDPEVPAQERPSVTGSTTQASAPPPVRAPRPISPPCRRTISREIARPSPVPPLFLVV